MERSARCLRRHAFRLLLVEQPAMLHVEIMPFLMLGILAVLDERLGGVHAVVQEVPEAFG